MALWGNNDNITRQAGGVVSLNYGTGVVTGTGTTFGTTGYAQAGDIIRFGIRGSGGTFFGDAVIVSVASTVSLTIGSTDGLSGAAIANTSFYVSELPKYTITDHAWSEKHSSVATWEIFHEGTSNWAVGVGTTNSGQIAEILISNPGDGYNFVPTITIDPPPDPIGNAAYVGVSTYQVTIGFEGMHINPTGDKMFTCHGSLGYTVGEVHSYDLSTAWDVNTATTANIKIMNFSGINFTYCTGIDFKPDGKTMYLCGLTDSGFKIVEYSLATAWDISSTMTYVASITTVSPSSIRFQDNGQYVFIMDTTNPDTIRKHELVTPWSISSLSLIHI